jgi:hypothetical protein
MASRSAWETLPLPGLSGRTGSCRERRGAGRKGPADRDSAEVVRSCWRSTRSGNSPSIRARRRCGNSSPAGMCRTCRPTAHGGSPRRDRRSGSRRSGDNLANVIQHLAERHGDRLERIFEALRQRVPRIERVLADTMPDGRLLLQIKDAPFSHPVLARFASDGTLKMLAYLVLLYDPDPAPFIGIEEPENFLHPRLLPELAEECRAATAGTQLLVTTHSPFFLNALRPRGARALARRARLHPDAAGLDLPGVRSSSNKGRCSAICGWRASSASAIRWSTKAAPTRPLKRGR